MDEAVVRIENAFPDLVADGYAITSKISPAYNCIAWAAGIETHWWDPAPGYVWPDGAPREYSIGALIKAYAALGFEVCASADVEGGYDKVALYGDQTGWTHAARQLPTGKWTSKLGGYEDIEHSTPDGLASSEYGKVACFMKRAKG